MRRRPLSHALAFLFGLAALAACGAEPYDNTGYEAAACRPVLRAVAPLRDVRNFLVAPVLLNGHPVALLIDTGAETTTLTPRVAVALHLPPESAHDRLLAGITGTVRAESVKLRQLTLGDAVVATDRSVALGDLPSLDTLRPPLAGLLGADVLSRFDVELDLPARRMALYAPETCADWQPWPDAVAVPIRRSISGLVLLEARVNGHSVHALLDTGARTSLMTRGTALALGVTPAVLQADATRIGMGVGGSSTTFRRHRFARFGVPGAIDRDMVVNVTDRRLPGVDLLLGADFLGRRDIWISYATGHLFLRSADPAP